MLSPLPSRNSRHLLLVLMLIIGAGLHGLHAQEPSPAVAALQAKGAKLKLDPAGIPIGIAIGNAVTMTLDDYKAVGQLTTLVRAEFGAKELTLNDETAAAIGKLDKLESIFANGAEISDEGLKALAGLKSLKQLGFDHWGWQIAKNGTLGPGLAYLAVLTNLQTVRFGGCKIDDRACAALAQVKSLQSMDFQHSLVTDAGIAAFTALPALRIIKLNPQYSPRITDASLVHLGGIKTLEEIEIGETWLTYDAGFAHLKDLTALKKMNLNNVIASDDDIAKLKADHPSVEVKWTKPDDAKAEKTKAEFKRALEAKPKK